MSEKKGTSLEKNFHQENGDEVPLYLKQPLMTRKAAHDMIEKLGKLIQENPSANWAYQWITCLSYFCSCVGCNGYLRFHEIDVKMLDKHLLEQGEG